jgi:hypothetical protein
MRAANFTGNGLNRRPLRCVFVPLLQDHANGPLPNFRGIPLLRFHNSILSKVGVSGKLGAVHSVEKLAVEVGDSAALSSKQGLHSG